MTSKQNDAFVRWSAALRRTDRLTKYFPSHGPFPMIDAKIFVSFTGKIDELKSYPSYYWFLALRDYTSDFSLQIQYILLL